jgi:hypothetical protein
MCCGGPWDGQDVKMSLLIGEASLVLRVGEFHGRYIKSATTLNWEDVK